MIELSLYIELEDGQKADLEATARAAIALSEAVKEIGSFFDPFSSVRIELVDGTEGSLSLNTVIKLLASGSKRDLTLAAIFLTCASWLGTKGLDFAWDKLAEHLWEQHVVGKERRLSPDEIREIADRVVAALAAKSGEKPVQRIYRELEADPAVKGVGVSPGKRLKPLSVVPKSEFLERGGLVSPHDPSVRRRSRIDIQRVVLVSPVLVSGKRRWKFRSVDGEFGAPIHDADFIERALSGRVPIIMKSNVEMTLEIETIEEFRNGAWQIVERNVLRVVGVPTQLQGDQISLPIEEK